MSTAVDTREDVEILSVLDFEHEEPCDWQAGKCSKVATHVAEWTCRCHRQLYCDRHAAAIRRREDWALRRGCRALWYCFACGDDDTTLISLGQIR